MKQRRNTMRKHIHHPDEHMALYEWCGAGTAGTGFPAPAESKRSHPWHASYGVLTVLTSLLLMYGCDRQGPAGQASESSERSVQEMKEQAKPLYEEATDKPGPADESGQLRSETIKHT